MKSLCSIIMCSLCLLTHNLVGINGEITVAVANVSKPIQSQKIFVPATGNKTTSPKPTTRSEHKPPQTDLPVLNVISVSAGHPNGETGYTMFPLPPTFHFPGNDGLEETFTYQVKKQRQPLLSDSPVVNEEFSLLQQRAKRESFEAMQRLVNNLNEELTGKVLNLSLSVENLSNGMTGNISAVTSAWDQLNQDVLNLTKLSKETARVMKTMQFNHEREINENKALMEQVAILGNEITSLKQERSDDINRVLATMSSLQSKMENTTHEIRVHGAHLRYSLQLINTLRESVDKNVDRITGLEKDGESQWTEKTLGCGGVVVANSGIISYKFRQPYLNNERCVWIIRANRKSKVNLQLLEDGFQNQSNSDFLTVTEFAAENHPVTLITSSRLEHGNNALHTFQGPVIFVTFYSDASSPGTGFTLKFSGVGNRSDTEGVNAVHHLNLHFSSPFGVFTYPIDSSMAATYQPNELVTIAINPTNANTVKIFMKHSDLEKDEYCEFDSVSFYGSVTGSYALAKRYCQHGENFSGEIIQSGDGIFLVIFRSDASTQFSGFQFTWEVE